MKLRYKILYMSFGAGLVVLGMVLNSLVSGDAEAQEGLEDVVENFELITCKGLIIQDENGRHRGRFGLDSRGGATLKILGDDGETAVAYLGGNPYANDEMNFYLRSKSFSETDERMIGIMIEENGGRFGNWNKMGEDVVRLGVGDDGGGLIGTYDKFGYVKKILQ